MKQKTMTKTNKLKKNSNTKKCQKKHEKKQENHAKSEHQKTRKKKQTIAIALTSSVAQKIS